MRGLAQIWQRYDLGNWIIGLMILLLLVLPLLQYVPSEETLVTNSLLFSFTQMFMLVTLASNWNLTGGFTGYVDFGHVMKIWNWACIWRWTKSGSNAVLITSLSYSHDWQSERDKKQAL